ncbi:MAG: helix-turn-helix transcriptional regulator [Fastidiosipilaceae bacterium]|jgi:transcriptional regulator with XRE-family HTH domain|nr:helix-turn-helix transcriptional regulator [Clostridiaceae bacterium]
MKYSLRELRARKNVTQKQAASDLGISTTTYNAWERDISRVAIGKVAQVARYYGVNLEEIKFEEKDRD